MKALLFVTLLSTFIGLAAQHNACNDEIISFEGQQVTGVTVSNSGTVYANFPRWRESVEYSVVEVWEDGEYAPYPNEKWNSWKPGDEPADSVFVAVQSVVAHGNKLYVLDTRNPLWQGVVNAPRIFVFDLKTNKLETVLILSEGSYKPNSYANDLRVDDKHKAIYITDSNEPALIVYNLKTGKSHRVLDGHYSTSAETDHLSFEGKKWKNTVHSDGIALNNTNNRLYYHALTGYTLYSVSAELLVKGTAEEIAADVKKEAETPAPDGMIFDKAGNLYMADLENFKIVFLTPEGEIKTLCQGEEVGWADTFSIYEGELYYTNSRIHEAGNDVSEMVFPIFTAEIE